jgi:hypothetical protein
MAITKKRFIFFARTGSHEGQAPIAVPASGAMSAIGTKRMFRGQRSMSAFGGKADIENYRWHFSYRWHDSALKKTS